MARFSVERPDVKVLGGGEDLSELAGHVVDGLPELGIVEQGLLCGIEILVVAELPRFEEPVHHFAGHGEICWTPLGHDDNAALPRVLDEVPHFLERIRFPAVGVAFRERVLAERRAKHPEHLIVAGVESERVEFELAAQIHALFDLRNRVNLMLDAHLDGAHPIVRLIADSDERQAQLSVLWVQCLLEGDAGHRDRFVSATLRDGAIGDLQSVCFALELRIDHETDVASRGGTGGDWQSDAAQQEDLVRDNPG